MDVKPETLGQLISASDNRQALYSFFARIYARELTQDFLKELAGKRNLWLSLAQDPEVRGTEMAEGLMTLAEYASKSNEQDSDTIQLELAAEYAGLFLGVWKVPAHPSESAYKNPEHLIMQKPRDDVLRIYRSMGLEKASEYTEPEDHIAIELQFMAYLCEKTSTALRNGNLQEAKKSLEVQRDFLNKHLGSWVPKLAADILKAARREFYKAVAKITKGYVEMDKEAVSEMIDTLALPAG